MNFRTNIFTKLSNKLPLNYRNIRKKLMKDGKDLQKDKKKLDEGQISNEPMENETDVANPANKSIRKINSQVFTTDEDTAVNESIPINPNTRRKSSWAFWNSANITNDDSALNDRSFVLRKMHLWL